MGRLRCLKQVRHTLVFRLRFGVLRRCNAFAVNLGLTLYKLEGWRKSLPLSVRAPLLELLWIDGAVQPLFSVDITEI
jgi:hypothetical protein